MKTRLRGVTLLETIVVLCIVVTLLALLIPAVQKSRNSARNTQCMNNLHQLTLAVDQYRLATKKLPDAHQSNTVSGWVIEILPFLEERLLAEQLAGNPNINQPSIIQLISQRPAVLTCPLAWEGESTTSPVPVAHYAFWSGPNRDWYVIGDVPLSLRAAWAESPEINLREMPRDGGPHVGGYYLSTGGAVSVSGNMQWFAGK